MTDQIKTRPVSTTTVETTIERDFGMTDRLGRKVGARVVLSTEQYEALEDQTETSYFYLTAPGSYYTARPSATRNGFDYGASQSAHLFETEAARDLYIAKYFKAAEKRAIKSHGPAS